VDHNRGSAGNDGAAISRWQAFTGEAATLEKDGRAFADIAAGRV
jgi:hypothetical protein